MSFDHHAHLHLTWDSVAQHGLIGALDHIPRHLQILAAEHAPGKYHTTLTWFFVLLVGERFRTGESFDMFLERNPDLLDGRRLARCYYPNLFDHPEARQRFMLPNEVA